MPLSEKARIEVYVPDLSSQAYKDLLATLDQEFTYAFGGCTIVHGLNGSYRSNMGFRIQDHINMIYTDAPFSLDSGFEVLSLYADELRTATFQALNKEAVLIVVYKIDHAE